MAERLTDRDLRAESTSGYPYHAEIARELLRARRALRAILSYVGDCDDDIGRIARAALAPSRKERKR